MAAAHDHKINKLHAFVLPYPVQGHIAPLMRFSKLLASKGLTVTFFNTQHNHFRLIQSKGQQSCEDPELDIRMVWLPDGLCQEDSASASASADDIVEQTHVEQSHVQLSKAFLNKEMAIQELVARLDPPVTCIISDVLAPFSQDISNKLGIPRVVFLTASAATHASMVMASQGFSFLNKSGDSNLITCVPGAPPLKVSEVNPFLVSGDPSDFMFDFFTRSCRRGLEADWLVVNTFEELEHSTLEILRKQHRIYPVGPVLPPSFFIGSLDSNDGAAVLWPEEYECLRWLDKQPPASVLYVSFGSIAPLTPQQLEELAFGLEASQQPVLWVARPDQMYGKSPVLPETFLHRTKDRVAIISWAPQLHVLSHPSVGGFLTHCGWNSTLESISAGVPMLGWPFFGDQMMNCRFMVDSWKVGLSLEADKAGCRSRGEVEKKVRELMQGEKGRELRDRAGELRGAALRGLQQGGLSFLNMELLIKGLEETMRAKQNGVAPY